MKSLSLSTALALTLTLSACGGATTPTPTPAEPNLTPEESEALTRTFTATGTTLNYAPNADVTLSTPVDDVSITVGTLKANGDVDIQITASQARSLYAYSYQEMADDWKADGCDVSRLMVKNAPYHVMNLIRFTAAGGVASVLKDQTSDKDSNGTTTQVISSFIFSLGNGSMTGKVTCNDLTTDVELSLKPGWNITKTTFVLDASRKLVSKSLGSAVHTSTYTAGQWNAFKGQF